MSDIIDWLIQVEISARDFYGDCVDFFHEDRPLSGLLQILADDEKTHNIILTEVANLMLGDNIDLSLEVKIDESIKGRILTPFKSNSAKLKANTLTKSDLYKCMLTTEYSEWNDIFLYVINSFAKIKSEYKRYASIMQKHIAKLEHFFNDSELLKSYYAEILKLPKIWKFKILIIDDEPIIRELLLAVFKGRGYDAEAAANGEEGLKKYRNGFYDAVVCDVEMPVMNGVDFYNKIKSEDSFDNESIVFVSGSEGSRAFFQENNARFLSKPFSVEEIIEELNLILLK